MMSPNVATAVAVTSAAGVMLLTMALTAFYHRRRRREEIPKEWRRVGTLSELTLYPLKSGAALVLEKGDCTEMGLRTTSEHPLRLQDRLFVVVDSEGNMRTARQHQNLLLVKVSRADEKSVTFQAPDMEDLTVPLPKMGRAKKVFITMWMKERAPGLDCGDEAAQWLEKYLGKEGLRLAYYDAEALGRRECSNPPFTIVRQVYKRFRPSDDSGCYSDLASFMLINAASVEDLKKRLEDRAPPTLTERWFRGNLVVSGAEPYAEDSWNFVRIGDTVVLQVFKPCTRCIMTTMDPENGKKTSNMEPLKTLRTYRQLTDPEQLKVDGENSPCMGMYLGLRQPGPVSVGDAVYVPKFE